MLAIKQETKELPPLLSSHTPSHSIDGALPTAATLPVASASLLGAAVTVRLATTTTAAGATSSSNTGVAGHAPRPATAALNATLLEVRRLWIPPECAPSPSPSSSTTATTTTATPSSGKRWRLPPRSPNTPSSPSSLSLSSDRLDATRDGPLLAYVRLKDGDHRLSGWVPLSAVEVKELGSGSTAATAAAAAADGGGMVPADVTLPAPLSRLVHGPALSRVYWHVTPGMARTLRSQKQLDFLEERLLRDCQTPTTVRYMVYLNEFIFAPWYYAPYGLLQAEYDPLGPEAVHTHRASTTMKEETRDGSDTGSSLKTRRVEKHFAKRESHSHSIAVTEDDDDAHDAGDAVEVVMPIVPTADISDRHARRSLTPKPEPSAQPRHGSLAAANTTAATPIAPPETLRINPYIRDAHLCPFSLRLFTTASQLRHEISQYRADRLRPPGIEIYRDVERGFSLFEVNGSRYVTYCRHLFLLGKSFLENKLAGHDVHSYYFYVVCLHQRHAPSFVADPSAMYFASYFTWEKQVSECNLACIVTLPCFATQGGQTRGDATGAASGTSLKGLGQFMIAVSYELAYRRNQIGSPEKPLSDLGAAAYQRYWQRLLLKWMDEQLTQHQHAMAIDVSSSSLSSSYPSATEVTAAAAAADGESESQSVSLRLKDIAEQVRLEDADVHTTLLHMGVLHRCTDDRSTQLLIPDKFVRWSVTRDEASQRRLDVAVFHAEKLLTKKQATSSSSSGGGNSGKSAASPPGGKRR